MKFKQIKNPFFIVTVTVNESFMTETSVELFTTRQLANDGVEEDLASKDDQYKLSRGQSFKDNGLEYGQIETTNKYSGDEKRVYNLNEGTRIGVVEPKNENEIINTLLALFHHSFINTNNEFIVETRYNTYFNLGPDKGKNDLLDLKLRLFAGTNRKIAKVYDEPYATEMLNKVNEFMGLNLTRQDHYDIYGDCNTWEQMVAALKQHPGTKTLFEGGE